MRHVPMELAQQLEHDLGSPEDPNVVFNYAECTKLDEAEEFPHEICKQLDDVGLPTYYVPARSGGRLTSYESTAQLVRMIARRDLGVAVAHAKTYLGGVCVWIAGDETQSAALGRVVASGVPVSWGLTEREHGSDLLGGDVVAQRAVEEGTYRLNGEKWPINNATRSGLMCLLARSDSHGGSRGFSLFLVDKARLDVGSYECLPKVPTHGNRGADISGIVLKDAVVDSSALVGTEGAGLEIVLKGLQVTRTLCAALSLGAADHALRVVVDTIVRRGRHGHRLMDHAGVRRTVAMAYADHLLAEALSTVAFRAIHTLTSEMSVVAAVTKYLVPTRTEAAIARLRQLLGPSALLPEGQRLGSIAKIERDHRVVSLFDGNTVVNLHTLINLFPLLSRARIHSEQERRQAIEACCALSRPLPEVDLDRLTLVPRQGASILLSTGAATAELAALARRNSALGPLVSAANRLCTALEELWGKVRAQRPTRLDVAPYSFNLAKRLALCFAGFSAIQLWLRNHNAALEYGQQQGDSRPEYVLWRNGIWLRAVLARILGALGDRPDAACPAHDALFDVLASQVASGHLPSLFRCRLAEGMG